MTNPMVLSMGSQARLFLLTVAVGAGMGLFFDFFRVIRRTMPFLKGDKAVQIEDFIFWVTVTLAMFYFMMSQNFGEIRLFSFIGAGVGMALYFATVSRLVMRAFVAVVNYLKKVIATALRIIFLPLRFLAEKLAPPAKTARKKLRSGLCRVRRYVKIRIRKSARSLFILRKKV